MAVKIFSGFLIFYQTLLLPQVKGDMIISTKNSIYELPRKLQNNSGLRILGNYEISNEFQNCRKL